jgi:dienelactone hydrolase
MYLYPGDQHLFMDRSLAAYDAEATALLTERVLDFLATR